MIQLGIIAALFSILPVQPLEAATRDGHDRNSLSEGSFRRGSLRGSSLRGKNITESNEGTVRGRGTFRRLGKGSVPTRKISRSTYGWIGRFTQRRKVRWPYGRMRSLTKGIRSLSRRIPGRSRKIW